MKDVGAFLAFSHKDGGELLVTLTGHQKFEAVFKDLSGQIQESLTGLDVTVVSAVIEQYLDEDAPRPGREPIKPFVWFMPVPFDGE